MNSRRPSSLRQQRGLSLIIVMVIALLSVLLTLGTARVVNFNEVRAGNDTDNQQAFEAAQAMIREAQLDITIGGTTLDTHRSRQGGGSMSMTPITWPTCSMLPTLALTTLNA